MCEGSNGNANLMVQAAKTVSACENGMENGMGVRRTKQVVADVNRPLMSVAKMVAAGNRVHLDSKDPRIVRPKGEIFFFEESW